MGKDDKPRDLWSKLEVVAKAVGAIVVPIVVLLIGQGFNDNQRRLNDEQLVIQRQAEVNRLNEQAAADVARQQADRLTLLLSHLGSSDERQRLLAIKVAEHYAASKQLPEEIVPVLIGIAQTGKPQEAAAAVATLQALPAIVHIHIQTEEQRAVARGLQTALEGRGVTVPSIQRVGKGPARAELRFFRADDRAEAEVLVGFFREAGLEVTLRDLTREYSTRRAELARHFEVWFGPGVE
jgi:hypothetical protein